MLGTSFTSLLEKRRKFYGKNLDDPLLMEEGSRGGWSF